MAATDKRLIAKLIEAKRLKGMNDKEIFDEILNRKDEFGGNIRGMTSDFESSGAPNFKEQAAKVIGLDIKQIKGNSQVGSGNKSATVGDKLTSYATSVGAGIGKVGAGLLQPIAIAGDTVNKGINSTFGTNLSTGAEAQVRADSQALDALADKKRLAANRKGVDIPKFGGEMAATAPAFLTGAGGSTMGARALDQGLRGAAVGGLQLTQVGDDSNQRLYNMAGGFVGGAAGQAGGEVVSNVIGKGVTRGVNAIKGNKAPKAQAIDDLGKQYGVRMSVGDIKGGGIIKNTETHLERVPVVGLSKFRTGQHAEAQTAAKGANSRQRRGKKVKNSC